MSSDYHEFDADSNFPPVRELSRVQRRVLGVLVEKAFTVPESYPLTLKAVVTGSNQKNNRDPVTNYSEDDAAEALEQLRDMGLVAVVHTESGRTERYRHYARKRFPFTEPQLAIITELLLRGSQQLGELRARASRMVPIESLPDLRQELDGLMASGFVRAGGPLERRGVEVDHAFYPPGEASTLGEGQDAPAERPVEQSARHTDPVSRFSGAAPAPSSSSGWQEALSELRAEHRDLSREVHELRDALQSVQSSLAELRQNLGA